MIEDLNTKFKEIIPKVKMDIANIEESVKAVDQRYCDQLKAIPKMTEDLSNFQKELARQKEEVKKWGKRFSPSDALFEMNAWKPKTDKDEAPKVPLNGIIAYMTRECGGNVHDCNAVVVTSSTIYCNYVAKNVVDLEDRDSQFCSAFHRKEEDIPHARNNWICYDFGERRIVPTHYAIRTYGYGVNGEHLKNWVVETSLDGKLWTEIDRKENNSAMNAFKVTRIFDVSRREECRFIRLVNVGRNWYEGVGDDVLDISAWEIFGVLLEN